MNQKSARLAPGEFEDQYEAALIYLIHQKRSRKPNAPRERTARGERRNLQRFGGRLNSTTKVPSSFVPIIIPRRRSLPFGLALALHCRGVRVADEQADTRYRCRPSSGSGHAA